jgi:hypothetical protein
VNGELVLRRTHLVTYPQDLLLGGSGCCPHSQLRTLSLREAAQLSGSQSQYWLLRADPELRINEGHALKEESTHCHPARRSCLEGGASASRFLSASFSLQGKDGELDLCLSKV